MCVPLLVITSKDTYICCEQLYIIVCVVLQTILHNNYKVKCNLIVRRKGSCGVNKKNVSSLPHGVVDKPSLMGSYINPPSCGRR